MRLGNNLHLAGVCITYGPKISKILLFIPEPQVNNARLPFDHCYIPQAVNNGRYLFIISGFSWTNSLNMSIAPVWLWCSFIHFAFVLVEKKTTKANKKRSLLRLTWLKFLRAGGRLFFLLNIFYMQIRYANLYFSRAGNSDSGTDSLAARRTLLPESPSYWARPRVCWTVGHVRATRSSPLSRASSARAPPGHFRRWCEKKDMAPVFSCFVRSLELKSKAWNSKTRYLQARPATSRAMWHPRPRCRRHPLQRGFLTWGSWQILSLASP